MINPPKNKYPIAVALDVDWVEAKQWVMRLSGHVWGFKIGSALFTEYGIQAVDLVKNHDCNIFLDLKFHDIPNTVSKSLEAAKSLGVQLATVHGLGGEAMLRAAHQMETDNFHAVAVSVLTSMNDQELAHIGIEAGCGQQVDLLVALAYQAGLRHFVCSPFEAKALKQRYSDIQLITPGIRLESFSNDDQRRVMSPKEALKNGSDCLVIGRALTAAKDWERQWEDLKSSLDVTF